MRRHARLGLIALFLVGLLIGPSLFAQSTEVIECPACFNLNPAENNYCIYCGTALRGVFSDSATRNVLEVGVSRIFHLKDGNAIRGKITSIDGDSVVVISTENGDLHIPSRSILPERVDILKYDGTRFVGPVVDESDYEITVQTSYGRVSLLKQDIRFMQRYQGNKQVSWTEEKEQFVSLEEITDVFMDPTAFPLHAHTVYLSGLSVGYGFTPDFMLRTRYGSDLVGDLNLQPFWRIYHGNSQRTEVSLGIGTELYNRHPIRYEVARYSHWIVDASSGVRQDKDDQADVKYILANDSERQFFASIYMVVSRRSYLASGRGRWGWHLGLRTNSMAFNKPELAPGYKWADKSAVPFRAWLAMDYDLMKNLKFLIEVFADNGHKYVTFGNTLSSYFDNTPFVVDPMGGDYQPIDFDFGAIYALSENFRIGLHFQSPFLAIYWKW